MPRDKDQRGPDSAAPAGRYADPASLPANDNSAPMNLFAKVFERQAERAATRHAGAVKRRLAERAKEPAGERDQG
ncbi:MAG: hypothetical protein F4X99_19220 [Gammaproteobacteria bacterium]|nr:hypothetical protein [Gammaproteobacteria bacterium]